MRERSQSLPTSLGTEKISKLLRQYAIPAIIAMTASSLYNIVDSIFIGHGVGPFAISGLAVTFPLINLSTAFGMLVGVGGATLISVRLGQKDYKSAQKIFGHVFVLNSLIGILFMAFFLYYLTPILFLFRASEATIPYARDYMQIILYGNAITYLYFGLNAVLRSAGHPKTAMYMTIMTVLLNTILDALFILVFKWGIQGAAIATVLSQLVALVWQIILFSDKRELLHFHRGIYRLKMKIVRDIFSIGMAPFLMNVASCLIIVLINHGLKKYGGDLAIGAYGIINRVAFLFLMIVFGLNQGMQPIAGYNYGANQIPRVLSVLKITIFYATMVTTFGFIVGVFFPHFVVRAFTSDVVLLDAATNGMRIMMLMFPLVGFQVVISNFFQSIGMPSKAIVLSLSRQVLILVPCLIIMPTLFGIDGVWASLPTADVIAAIIAAIMITRQIKQFKKSTP